MKTRRLLILLFGLFIGQTSFTQDAKPEKVYSIIEVYKPYEWYTQQHGLWEKELKKGKKNTAAWVNFYVAARMAKIMSPSDTLRNSWYAEMQLIIAKMEKAIPNTYEYYHLKTWNSDIWSADEEETKEIISWSKKAYSMDPERTGVYPDLMNACMITGDLSETKTTATNWIASGDISPNLMALSYNMLMSTEKNAILITGGDNDTYPVLALQYGKGIREDVTVINIYCAAGSEVYRNRLLKKNGIPPLTGVALDKMDVVNHIIKNAGDVPVYFAYGDHMAGNPEIKDNMYNVGLAFRYSDSDYNNNSVLLNNFENKFLMDHLKMPLYSELFPEQVKRHNLCYLPGLMILYQHYKIVENEKAQRKTKELIQELVRNTSHEEAVNANFANE